MSFANFCAATPFASLRRVGLHSLCSLASGGYHCTNEGAFVARHGLNARRPAINPHDIFVGSSKKSIISSDIHMKSTQPLCSANDLISQDNEVQEGPSEDIAKNHFHCYLLRSLDPDHPLKTYIGFTTNPQRRLRQHNGEIARGARRTKRGRPWEYVAVIDGFQDKVSAMQFEWAWQHVGRSKVFREAVGCDKLAKRMKRRRGVEARLEELGILLNDCPPFNSFPLKVFFPETEDHDLFCNMAKETYNTNNVEVRTLADMSFIKGEPLGGAEVVKPSIGSGISLSGNSISGLTKMRSGLSDLSIDSISCNPLFRLGLRSKSLPFTSTSWALNAVADASVQESQNENKESDNDSVQVKVPAKFKPYPFPYHKELTVRIESLTNLGFGIARVELDETLGEDVALAASGSTSTNDNGNEEADNSEQKKWVIFVPNVIPGELVSVRIYRNYATYSDADLLQIIEPSSDRIEPQCSLAKICGGCQYQHITIDRQRKMKTMQVQELFERLGGFDKHEFPAVLDTLGTDEVFGYRSKITPHYDAPIKKKGRRRAQNNGDTAVSKVCEIGPIGFKEKASRRLVDVPYCHIATDAINDALAQIREDKREEARQGLLKKPTKGATLLLRDADGVVETDNNAYVNTTVKDLVFQFQAGNFFQNNPFMLPKMVDLVVDAATKESAGGKKMTHLIDCYCGSGLFAIGSSRSFDVCVGIEVNEKAVEEARDNAALNGIQNCDFVSASAEAIFQSQDPVRIAKKDEDEKDLLVGDFPRDSTVVVVDPPRKGCSEEFLAQLNEYRPARVVYMSCDPATQARDSKFLVSYGYEIVSIQPFDLFPQTRHIECLAIFERAAE